MKAWQYSGRLGYLWLELVSLLLSPCSHCRAYTLHRNYTNSWAWRIPTIVQAGLPAVVAILVLFFPESPRWLIAHDRAEEALAIFAKYHGDGDANSPICQLQYKEVMEDNAATQDENPWWNFTELFNTRAARYRLAMVIGMSFFGQWSGNNVVSYFLVRFNFKLHALFCCC